MRFPLAVALAASLLACRRPSPSSDERDAAPPGPPTPSSAMDVCRALVAADTQGMLRNCRATALRPGAIEDVAFDNYEAEGGYVARFSSPETYKTSTDQRYSGNKGDEWLACPRANLYARFWGGKVGDVVVDTSRRAFEKLCPY